jgi:outer membrane protein insertion porin family
MIMVGVVCFQTLPLALGQNAGGATQPAAPTDPKKPVSAIRIIGNKDVTDGFIRQQIRNVKLSKPLNTGDLQKDLDNLKLTGKFTDVYANTSIDEGKLIVNFHVVERPTIQSIQFVGARQLKTKDLQEVLDFNVGDPLDLLKVRSGVENLTQKYRDSGFTEASVTLDDEALEEGSIVYNITEGPKVRVNTILFEGNNTFSDRRLKGKVDTKTYVWILRPGTYAENQIQEDIASLRNYYRTEGFLDAQVGRRINYSPDRQKMTITFLIDEGIRYSVNSISVEGNTVYTSEAILSTIQLAPGKTLNLDQMEADRKAIVAKYAGDGYIYATVDISYAYGNDPGTVNLTVKITEGDTYKIGRIIVRGNKKTQDRVVRRTLDFYPTQTFDLNKMQEREKRLRETRLFNDVQIRPVPGESSDERDALIQVEEADTTRVMAGAGVTSNNGVVGSLSIENINFNIWDKPRSAGEFFRGQSFKGAGQTLKISLEPGTEMTTFRIDFRNPYIFDLPIAFGWSAYIFERDRDGYDENRYGTIFSFDKIFKKIYSVGTAFRVEGIDINDIDKHFFFFAPEDILDVQGSSFLTSAKLSLARDTTDSILMPTRGTRIEGSWEQAGAMGGDYEFSKLIAQATHYKTLRTDIYDRKTVWASNATAGYIIGDAPVFERFYGGGIGSIRGFKYRGISPRQWPSHTAVGADSEFLIGNEVSFPLVGKMLRGVTFVDMGSVDNGFSLSDWRIAPGFGIRLTLDFFGPVPMAFDFAFPISKGEDDETQIFSFSLGATFK